MKVSIIIVTYNTKDLTDNCIKSIRKFTEEIDYEIILVDNGSTDDSKNYFEADKTITYIYSSENLGFGKANNLGAESATGEFVFLLNSDTIFKENSLLKFYNFFILNELKLNIGVLGCLLVDEKGKVNGYGNSFPSCKVLKNKLWNKIPIIAGLLPVVKDKNYNHEGDFFEIDYVIGADMFLKKKLYDKMNGFCEQFFMYYEETDLQKRISDIGLKQYIFTSTTIIHLEEASGKAIKNYSNRKRIITERSKLLYLKRNDCKNYSGYVITDFIFLLLNFFNFKYTFRENLQYFKAIIGSY